MLNFVKLCAYKLQQTGSFLNCYFVNVIKVPTSQSYNS